MPIQKIEPQMLFDVVEYLRTKVLREKHTILAGWDHNGKAVICTDFNLSKALFPGANWIYHDSRESNKFIGYLSDGSHVIWVARLMEVCSYF